MIKIGKKEVIYGYVDVIIAQLANIIVLPIVLHQVSTEEYALWNVFVSIQAFVMLFESGFAILVARFTTYAMSGAEEIPVKGKPVILERTINYKLLYTILIVSRKIYTKIAVFASFIMFVVTGYIYYVAKDLSNLLEVIVAWFFFVVGIACSLYFTYYTSFLKGAGKIKEMRVINITSNIMQSVLKIILILSGLGLLGISLSVTISVIYKRVLIRHNVFKVFKNQDINSCEIDDKSKMQLNDAFCSNAKQLGAVVVAQYIENQGTTLICSAFLPLDIIAKYGLTLQILGVISSVSSIPTSTFQSVLNQAIAQEDNNKSRYYYSFLTIIIMTTYLVGVASAYFVVPQLLVVIKSNTRILEGLTFILMSVYQLEIIMHQRATQLISYANDQSYAKSYVITAIIELLCAGVALQLFDGSVLLYVGLLAVAELYNFIIWPNKACKMIGCTVGESYVQGITVTYKYIMNMIRGKNSEGNR